MTANTAQGDKKEREVTFTTLGDQDATTTPAPVESTTATEGGSLDVQIVDVGETRADLLIFGGGNFSMYELLSYRDHEERPHAQIVARLDFLTPFRLSPLAPGELLSLSVQHTDAVSVAPDFEEDLLGEKGHFISSNSHHKPAAA